MIFLSYLQNFPVFSRRQLPRRMRISKLLAAGDGKRHYIIALDVGTTTVRACLFDQQCCLLEHVEKPVC